MELNWTMDMIIRWCLMMTTLVSLSVRCQRLVVNTTCLELGKPSNQQRRLSCDNPDHYHCLIDETYTKEFEMCRGWTWIPEGNCAYFHSFGHGNINNIKCIPLENMICSPEQYPSYENTKYTACYVKRYINTDGLMGPTSLPDVAPYMVSDWMNTTLLPSPATTDNLTLRIMQVLPNILGVLVPIQTLCGIYLLCRHSKGLHHCEEDPESDTSRTGSIEDLYNSCSEQDPMVSAENNDSKPQNSENAPSANKNVCHLEQEPLMSSVKTDGIPLMSGDVKETNPVTQAENCEERKQVEEEILPVKELVENTAGHTEQSGNVQMNEKSVEKYKEKEENKTATEDSDNENASNLESTEVFDDTIDSLQREVTIEIDEQEVKLCHELYDLLHDKGLDLSRDVLRLVIARTFGRTPEELLADEAVKNKLKTILPEESHRFLSKQEEGVTSIHVLYGMIQLYSGKEPNSGWGNPVKGSDIGFGDDVERLYRVYSIFKEISNPKTISVDNYTRLLDIMLTACTRLESADGVYKDSDHALKVKYKVLADKLKAIINPTWSQSSNKAIYSFIKQWSPWQQ